MYTCPHSYYSQLFLLFKQNVSTTLRKIFEIYPKGDDLEYIR